MVFCVSIPFESKLLPAVLLLLRIDFPKLPLPLPSWISDELPLPLPSWRPQSPLHFHWFSITVLKVISINFLKTTVAVTVLKCFWNRKLIILNTTVLVVKWLGFGVAQVKLNEPAFLLGVHWAPFNPPPRPQYPTPPPPAPRGWTQVPGTCGFNSWKCFQEHCGNLRLCHVI